MRILCILYLMSFKNLKIPICYSFETEIIDEFKKDIYIPIGCGGYNSSKMLFTDDIGNDNISKYNQYLNEMTMIYWLSKKYKLIGNPDFIGLAQYRRYLEFNLDDINENTILCSFIKIPYSIYKMYCIYHVKNDFDIFLKNFLELFKDYKQFLSFYLNQNIYIKCNMFILSKKLFFKYCDFINKCIDIALKILQKLNLDSRDTYQKRALGFILERMTGFWIFLQFYDKKINIKNTKLVELNSIASPYKRTKL